MPAVTPGDWLPLVVIRVITNLSYTMQRYKKYLKLPNVLAIIFDKIFSSICLIQVKKKGQHPTNKEHCLPII